MGDKNIESLHQKTTPILLLVDFLSTEIKIDKLYFLDLALTNLTSQKFNHFYICIKDNPEVYKDSIEKYPIFYEFLVSNNFGDLMREIDDLDYLYESYIIYPINYHIVNIHDLLSSYKDSDQKTIMSVYLTNYKDIVFGMNEDEIIIIDTKIRKSFFECLDKKETLCVRMSGFPEVVAIGKEFLALYNENYDFMNVGDLIMSSCKVNLYEYKIKGYSEETEKLCMRIKTQHEYYAFMMKMLKLKITDRKAEVDIEEAFSKCCMIDKNENDYRISKEKKDDTSDNHKVHSADSYDKTGKYSYKNSIIGKNCKIFSGVFINGSIIGDCVTISKDVTISESCVEDGCNVQHSITASVLSQNSITAYEYNDVLQIDDQIIENASIAPERIQDDSTETFEPTESPHSFHDDALSYLEKIASKVIARKINIDEVKREVNLIAIIWKASQNDLINVFVVFFGGFFEEDNLDQSTIDLMLFFPIIHGLLDTAANQEDFVINVYKSLRMKKKKNKKEAFVRLGYAMMDDGIIDKDVLNKAQIIKGDYFK